VDEKTYPGKPGGKKIENQKEFRKSLGWARK
jgi:hypothetical protein